MPPQRIGTTMLTATARRESAHRACGAARLGSEALQPDLNPWPHHYDHARAHLD